MQIDNPAFDYDKGGKKYSAVRQTDPGIAKYINEAIGNAKTVLNVGAGAGSYEPHDRYIVAVEPSAVMRSQRKAQSKVPAIIGSADALPFDDISFDASMAMLTVHHWQETNNSMEKGLKELQRVTKDKIIIMTFDPDALDDFWNVNYFPELIEIERKRYPKINFITDFFKDNCEVQKIPIPLDCADGFQEAYYGRPEKFLEKEVRESQSAWGFLKEEIEDKYVKTLSDELKSGEWDRKFGEHRNMPEFIGALRIIVVNL